MSIISVPDTFELSPTLIHRVLKTWGRSTGLNLRVYYSTPRHEESRPTIIKHYSG